MNICIIDWILAIKSSSKTICRSLFGAIFWFPLIRERRFNEFRNFRFHFWSGVLYWTWTCGSSLGSANISLESTSHRSHNSFFLLSLCAAQSSLHEASFNSFWWGLNISISIKVFFENVWSSLSVDHIIVSVRFALYLSSSDSAGFIRAYISWLFRFNFRERDWLVLSTIWARGHWIWLNMLWRKEFPLSSSWGFFLRL